MIGAKCAVLVAGFVAALACAGCTSQQERVRPPYASGESRLVGGGLKIEWEAPERGTVYLVEHRTGKLIQTFTLQPGQVYQFSVESVVQADDLETLLGIGVDKAEFLLYFKPAGAKEPAVRPGEPSQG